MKYSILIIQLIFLLPSNLVAQDLWNYVDGPIGENPKVLAADGANFLIAGTYHGLFKSIDSGLNWSYVGLDDIEITAFQLLPAGNCLVGTDAGLYLYKQSGDFIEHVTLPGYNDSRFLRIQRIKIIDSTIYSLTDYGIYYSTDSADTWIYDENFIHALNDITKTESGLFIAPDWSGYLFRSQDNGISWDTLATSFSTIQHLTSTSNGYLFASAIFMDDYTTVNGYVFRSTDHGLNWERMLPPTANYLNKLSWEVLIIPVALFSNVNDNLFFAKNNYNNYTGCNLVKSTDYGATWEDTQITGSFIKFVSMIEEKLYASTGSGIFLSLDSGQSFDLLKNGITPVAITSMEIVDRENFLVGTRAGLFSTTNNGLTWEMIGFEGKLIHKVILNNTGTIFCSVAHHGPGKKELFRSTDNGNNWEEVKIDYLSDCFDIEKGDNNEVYVFKQDHLFVSYDNGDSWQSVFGNDFQFDFQNSQLKIYNDNLVFSFLEYLPGGPVSKTNYSTNRGITWHEIYFNNDHLAHYSFSLSHNNILYTYNNRVGFCRTDDWGQTWSNLPLELESDYEYIEEIETNKSKVVIYKNGAAHYSDDYGVTWSKIFERNEMPVIRKLQFYDNSIYGIGIYKLAYIDLETIDEIAGSVPQSNCKLEQNYPNPFNSNTRIEYFISEPTHVSLRIYNTLGEEISVLENRQKLPGFYQISFNAYHLPSGVYFYQLTTDAFSQTKKMLLIR